MGIDPSDFDFDRLLYWRQLLRTLAQGSTPSLKVVVGNSDKLGARVGFLPGSYNPLTLAHLALADSALASGYLDVVIFSIATRTVNKEKIEGLSLEDRLLLLSRVAEPRADLGIALVNRGLYVDQSEIAHSSIPALKQLWFVVGFDKIVQIFDPRYYDNRDRALTRLFELASFLVAPRGDEGERELEDLLDLPENRRFRSSVVRLVVPPYYRDMSSSRVRATAIGAIPDVPALVERFIENFGVYGHRGNGMQSTVVDGYLWRQMLLDAYEHGDLPRLSSDEFADLWLRTAASGTDGEFRRAALANLTVLASGTES